MREAWRRSSSGARILALIFGVGLFCWVALVIYAFRLGSQERSETCLVVYAYIQQHSDPEDLRLLRELPCKGSTADRKGK